MVRVRPQGGDGPMMHIGLRFELKEPVPAASKLTTGIAVPESSAEHPLGTVAAASLVVTLVTP